MPVKRRISPLIPILIALLLLALASQTEIGRMSCRKIIPAKFRTFKIHLPYGYEMHGIDISRYQGDIDWHKLIAARQGNRRISFVFIKATQGANRIDPCFRTNWQQAHQHRVIRGAYHYFEPHVKPELQAQQFFKHVQLKPGDLPPVLDVEEIGNNSKQQLRQKVKDWLLLAEKKYKVKPILYVPARFYQDILGAQFQDYPIWVAHYYKYKLPETLAWTFWQHSDKGQVPGILGPVDFNVFRGSRAEFQALRIKP
jgi:lysozyme